MAVELSANRRFEKCGCVGVLQLTVRLEGQTLFALVVLLNSDRLQVRTSFPFVLPFLVRQSFQGRLGRAESTNPFSYTDAISLCLCIFCCLLYKVYLERPSKEVYQRFLSFDLCCA